MTEQVRNNLQKSKWLKAQVFRYLSTVSQGYIAWHDEQTTYFGDVDSSLQVTVTVHDAKFYRQFVWRGSIGAATSYIQGEWSCDNLTALMQIIILNTESYHKLERRFASVSHVWLSLKNLLNRNYIERAKKNIVAHYDLSNDFFKYLLGQSAQYSCAIFRENRLRRCESQPSAQQVIDDMRSTRTCADSAVQNLTCSGVAESLYQAQVNKMAVICRKLQLTATDHLLEIGTGWGELAFYAVETTGCRVTTTTISDAQYDYVKQQIHERGLEKQITLLKQDYRHLTGEFDKCVSVEMIEAVGHQYLNKFFGVCHNLLKPGGLFCCQAITIADQEFARYKREIDFIKAFIFPGGCLPSLNAMSQAITNHTRFTIVDIEDIGEDYAITLEYWYQNLMRYQAEIQALGFDEKFIRLFEFYFCYCQAGFLRHKISDLQILMVKS